MMASSAFHAGHTDVAEIETAYHTLTPLLGIAAAGVFLLSLLASGVSSSTVGTMAGQLIMQGAAGTLKKPHLVGFVHLPADLPGPDGHVTQSDCRLDWRGTMAGGPPG